MGLEDVTYGTTRSNVLATDPLPPLNRVYATMVQEERMKLIAKSKEERGMVVGLAVQTGYKPKGRGDGKNMSMVFAKCGKLGHDEKGCFQIIGYPDWWGERPRNEGGNIGRNQPKTGGSRRRSATVRANVTQVATEGHADTGTDNGRSEMVGLSNEQWHDILKILNSRKSTENEKMTGKNVCDLWIIDSGASNHMTGTMRNFNKERTIEGCPVGLPNGEHVLANKEGDVVLDGGLKLKNVLYVPKLKCNLISVSQLTEEAECLVLFTNKFCVMQDLTSKMLIRAGEQRDGLYLYHGMGKMQAFHTSTEK